MNSAVQVIYICTFAQFAGYSFCVDSSGQIENGHHLEALSYDNNMIVQFTKAERKVDFLLFQYLPWFNVITKAEYCGCSFRLSNFGTCM